MVYRPIPEPRTQKSLVDLKAGPMTHAQWEAMHFGFEQGREVQLEGMRRRGAVVRRVVWALAAAALAAVVALNCNGVGEKQVALTLTVIGVALGLLPVLACLARGLAYVERTDEFRMLEPWMFDELEQPAYVDVQQLATDHPDIAAFIRTALQEPRALRKGEMATLNLIARDRGVYVALELGKRRGLEAMTALMEPAPVDPQVREDQLAAVEFYRLNPSAALFDLNRRTARPKAA